MPYRKAKILDLKLKQQQIQAHELAKIESQKVDREVNVVEMPIGTNNKLKFYNKGMAVAYNVAFEITTDIENNIQMFMDKSYLPFPKLLTKQCFEITYIEFSKKPHQTILMTWDDDFGKERSKEMVVDM